MFGCRRFNGGFTDCLLQNGAACVTAVDVGYAQFSWELRNNPKVELIEKPIFVLLRFKHLIISLM